MEILSSPRTVLYCKGGPRSGDALLARVGFLLILGCMDDNKVGISFGFSLGEEKEERHEYT